MAVNILTVCVILTLFTQMAMTNQATKKQDTGPPGVLPKQDLEKFSFFKSAHCAGMNGQIGWVDEEGFLLI